MGKNSDADLQNALATFGGLKPKQKEPTGNHSTNPEPGSVAADHEIGTTRSRGTVCWLITPTRSPRSALFSVSFLGEGSPTKIDNKKKTVGTFILTSPLKNLVALQISSGCAAGRKFRVEDLPQCFSPRVPFKREARAES